MLLEIAISFYCSSFKDFTNIYWVPNTVHGMVPALGNPQFIKKLNDKQIIHEPLQIILGTMKETVSVMMESHRGRQVGEPAQKGWSTKAFLWW
jgi:hypothetical protein